MSEPVSPHGSPRGDPARSAVLGAGTEMGAVRLTVSDLERSRWFYATVLGLQERELDDGGLAFGPAGEAALVELRGDSSAPTLDRRATGLFHLAMLVPSRHDLAHALARVAQARWPLDGASDHLVSEALYLSDPDGNGIEIYRDRPRPEWSYDSDGGLEMATLALDLDSLIGELGDGPGNRGEAIDDAVTPGTRMGHVHLQVADVAAAEAFYHGVLGFDVTVRGYPGALFVSAGGYHHHIGLNAWNSAGSSPPAAGSVGLRSFELVLEDQSELERLLARIAAAGLSAAEATNGSGTLVRDPSGNTLALRAG